MIQKQNRYGEQSLTPVIRMIFGNLYTPEQVKGQGAFKFRMTAVMKPQGNLFENLLAQAERLRSINFSAEVAAGDKIEFPLAECSKMKAFRERPEYAGLWVIKASANVEYPPKITGQDGLDNMTPGYIYPGCYLRASIQPYAFDNMSKGVSFGLVGVQFIKDGKRIGGGIDPTEQFAAVQPPQEELDYSLGETADEGDDAPF